MNPYQVLGVSPTDDEDTIKKAYRKAAKECHPDTHPGDKRAEERFKEIGEAYRILSDNQKGEEFARFFSMGKQSEKKENSSRQKINPMDVTDLFERYMGFKY